MEAVTTGAYAPTPVQRNAYKPWATWSASVWAESVPETYWGGDDGSGSTWAS